MKRVVDKEKRIENFVDFIKKESADPSQLNPYLVSSGTNQMLQKQKLATLLLRPQVNLMELINNSEILKEYLSTTGEDDREIIEQVEIIIKYNGYIRKEQELANKLSKVEDIQLKEDFKYREIGALSYEAREKLSKIKPKTIGQASRISGVSPSDISVLLVYLGR